MLSAFGILCAMNGASRMIGHRVLVDGMMGSGKSTFARALAARTGLPVIHLDVHYWKPGWVRPSDDEWRERQRALLAGKAWIIDGNDNETLALRVLKGTLTLTPTSGSQVSGSGTTSLTISGTLSQINLAIVTSAGFGMPKLVPFTAACCTA